MSVYATHTQTTNKMHQLCVPGLEFPREGWKTEKRDINKVKQQLRR